MALVANITRFLAVQKFWKSVKIWQSYREFKCGNFSETQCRYEHWHYVIEPSAVSLRYLNFLFCHRCYGNTAGNLWIMNFIYACTTYSTLNITSPFLILILIHTNMREYPARLCDHYRPARALYCASRRSVVADVIIKACWRRGGWAGTRFHCTVAVRTPLAATRCRHVAIVEW